MADLLKKKFSKSLIGDMAFRLAKESYNSKIEDQEKLLKKLGDDIYNSHLASHLELIKSLPEGWLNAKGSLNVKFVNKEDKKVNLVPPSFREKSYSGDRIGQMQNYSYDNTSIELSNYRAFPHYWTVHSIPILADSEFAKSLVKIKMEIAELQKAQYNFYDEMVGLLSNLGSFKALYEFWPEVRDLLREFEPEPPPPKMLPTAPINDYNKLLEIPKEKVMTATP